MTISRIRLTVATGLGLVGCTASDSLSLMSGPELNPAQQQGVNADAELPDVVEFALVPVGAVVGVAFAAWAVHGILTLE